MSSNNTKRIAKNTMFMYMRMILLMLISLYSSRILLKELGVEDFGVYNLVGSLVIMFNSLRGIFSSSTQRFLNFEMGRNNFDRLQKIFSMSIQVNFFIACVFVIAAEIFGWWFFNYKINIDPSRMFAAQIVFQLTIATSVVSVMTTPFDAIIIANERLNFYAYISILEAILKLCIIFILPIFGVDKLILYGVLLFSVQILIRFINSIYCKVHFKESKFTITRDKSLFKEMFSFAGWSFLGNTGYSLINEGLNMVLNIYGGAVVNAARGLAYQIRYAIEQFLNSVNKAVDPFAVKTFAKEDVDTFYKIHFLMSKILYFVYLAIALSLYLNTENVLNLWLPVIPKYTIIFVQLIIINGLIRSLGHPLNLLFEAANEVKYYHIRNIIVNILLFLTGIAVLEIGFPYESVFVVMVIFSFIQWFTMIIQAKILCDFPLKSYLTRVVIPLIIHTALSIVWGVLVFKAFAFVNYGWLIGILIIAALMCLQFYCIVLNNFERNRVKSIFVFRKNVL